MARYFFHMHDGVGVPDEEGTELPDWQTAQQEAMIIAGVMIADNGKKKKLGEDWGMTVTDQAGLTLFRVDFHIAEMPVLDDLKIRCVAETVDP